MRKLIHLFVTVILAIGCVLTSGYATENEQSKNIIGKIYYTKVNIWYEKQNKILSANWHVGAILRAGAKVKVLRFGRNRITFEAEGISSPFTIINASRYSRIRLGNLFNQYFSKDDIKAEGAMLSKFSVEELENIKRGTIAEGMSKEAVLVAYGYPPSHRTPDVSSDYWQYWRNKFVRDLVYFQDNKVVKIEKTMRP